MKEFIKPDFIPVFKETRDDKSLTPLDRLVHGAIYWYEQLKDGHCFASNESIAMVVGADSERSVANSIQRLTKLGYLKCEYTDSAKRNRKSIKFIRKNIDTLVDVSDTLVNVSLDTLDNVQKKNNIKYNNKGEYTTNVVDHKDINYLLNIPEQDIDMFREKYKVTKSEILLKAESMHNWAGSVGKKYKNYKLFLMGALLRDYGLRTVDNSKSRL